MIFRSDLESKDDVLYCSPCTARKSLNSIGKLLCDEGHDLFSLYSIICDLSTECNESISSFGSWSTEHEQSLKNTYSGGMKKNS